MTCSLPHCEVVLKRLDWDFCLWLDQQTEPLAQFLYGHLVKRMGEKGAYTRNLLGFLQDCGLGYIASLEPRRRTEKLRDTVFPTLGPGARESYTRV